ncbi:hypothetical protein BN2475_590005 [Paraburkholderia ribeironis]|uniref:Uncharacterized protein n=1 Tax=Paraburkholderia ribeironis TaxID=1247936 RepID=A0A1N7SEI4_9BURK|nr:hypothetical protein BN2475_590005 [Paraburkholderia ribeironis]
MCRCCCVSTRRSKSTTTSTAGFCRSCCARCWLLKVSGQANGLDVLQGLRPVEGAADFEARPLVGLFLLWDAWSAGGLLLCEWGDQRAKS